MDTVVHLIPGDAAPKYDRGQEISLSHVTITEQGTVAGLPIVDFVMTDPAGNQYLLVLTGRIVNMISAAVRGANLRNHGVEEP